jgi:hypothetical protein
MKCSDARDAILDADRAVLGGLGQSALAAHIRTCPACRRRARAIVEEEAALFGALRRAAPRLDPEAVLERAAGRGETHSPRRWRRSSQGPGSRKGLALFSLAAAAVLALLFLGRTPRLPGPTYYPAPPPTGLEVQAPPGENVAVLATNDPTITVLWLF